MDSGDFEVLCEDEGDLLDSETQAEAGLLEEATEADEADHDAAEDSEDAKALSSSKAEQTEDVEEDQPVPGFELQRQDMGALFPGDQPGGWDFSLPAAEFGP
jgi:hypothetical protein